VPQQSRHRPSGSHRSSVRDRYYSPGYKAIWYAPTQYIQPHTSTPLLVMSRAGECSRVVMENPLPPHLGTRLTGLIPDKCLVHVQKLSPRSHWTGAQIPCSYHMSNPFRNRGDSKKETLFSRVTNITRLLPGP
jgi:hypothetical protein